jgi:UDP:flavonoid glycosyltransferase YjiC (YdhE family)
LQTKKKILVAPLNMGLGHATRCIPIIEALDNHGFEPVIASDGAALALLKKEFPEIQAFELPPCRIDYALKGTFFKVKQLLGMPRILRYAASERRFVAEIVKKHDIQGIISDSRPGTRHAGIPSVFITHMLNVPGDTMLITAELHKQFIRQYDECWIPDVKTGPNLSGKLGHTDEASLKLKYIGPVSRLHKKTVEKLYDLMVLLSGPEPYRSQLEEKLVKELQSYKGRIIFIRGIVEAEEKKEQKGNILYYNFMNTALLEETFNASETVLCRSGYSSIMDLSKLGKKALFIPTPGQYEQEYLAKKMRKAGLAPFSTQKSFKAKDLKKVALYKGLKEVSSIAKWKDLFSLFEGK